MRMHTRTVDTLPMKASRRVTSNDVARAAGVSQPTVSRALRGDPRIAANTRRHVAEVAERMGYHPDEKGRALATRSTGRVGVVAAELNNPFYPALLAPMTRELAEAGYRTVLLTDPVMGEVDIAALVTGSLDGVILTSTLESSRIPETLNRFGVPFVMANRTVPGVAADASVADNESGAREAARLLIELGHRRIAGIFGRAETSTSRLRTQAFRDRLAEADIALRPDLSRFGAFTQEWGYEAFTQLMSLREPPTAVFCANDVIAFGALNAGRDLNIDIPRDVTVIGFDNIPLAGWPIISLTTVDSDVAGMGRAAVDLLLARIREPDRPVETRSTATSLVLRATHGPRR